jgi:hypothetical protein
MEITQERLLEGARNLKAKGYSPQQVDNWLKTKGSSLDEMKVFASTSKQVEEPIVQEQPIQQNQERSLNDVLRQIGGATVALDRGKNLGFGKKLGAAVYAAGSYPVDRIAQLAGVENTPSFSDRYNEVFQDAKAMGEEFAKEHPVLNIGTELYGAIKGAPTQMTKYALGKAGQLTVNSGKTAKTLADVLALGGSGAAASVGTGAGETNNIIDYVSSPQAALDATFGGGANIALPVAGRTLRGAGRLLNKGLGMTTGVGEGVIDRAFDAGKRSSKPFLDNLRGKVSSESVVAQAKGALKDMTTGNSDLYKTNLAKAFEDTTQLKTGGIFKNIKDIVREETLGNTIPLSGEEKSVIEKATEFLKPAQNNRIAQTTKGLDKIRRKIADIKSDPGTNADRIKKSITNSIKDSISEQRPEYRKGLETYAKNKNEIEEIARTFSIKENNAIDTAMRKLQSVGRNNVQTNYGYRNKLMDTLDFGGSLQDAIAGQAMNSWIPRGAGGRIIGTANLATLYAKDPLQTAAYAYASSPRAVGESVYKLGQLVDALERAGIINRPVNIGGLKKRVNE